LRVPSSSASAAFTCSGVFFASARGGAATPTGMYAVLAGRDAWTKSGRWGTLAPTPDAHEGVADRIDVAGAGAERTRRDEGQEEGGGSAGHGGSLAIRGRVGAWGAPYHSATSDLADVTQEELDCHKDPRVKFTALST
jgi:hypothetical protein